MRRRQALAALLALGGAATTAFAQRKADPVRLAYLTPVDPGVSNQLQEFKDGMRDLGYREGDNYVLEVRSAGGAFHRLPEIAAELVRVKPRLMIGSGTAATLALKGATRTIPIVMIGAGDPVGTGLVASLARPGGNVTGVSNLSPPLMRKRLELLKEVQPRAQRIAVLLNPANPAQRLSFEAIKDVAAALKVELLAYEARDLDGIRSALAAMGKQRVDGIALGNDGLWNRNAGTIIELAEKQRLPVAGNVEIAHQGGLIGYGSILSVYRDAARYVDKILKGAVPGSLPVEQPTRFELVINLKSAKALGIAIPPPLRVRAGEVIE